MTLTAIAAELSKRDGFATLRLARCSRDAAAATTTIGDPCRRPATVQPPRR
jgi:hypothetical protein